MEQTSTARLTRGPIMRVLLKLALPIMASSFLSTAYSLTDMAWVGMLGSKAVAAIGVGSMYLWLSQGLSTLARMGGQVHVAQCLGRGETKQARHFAAAALQLVILFGLGYGAVCLLLSGPLISFYHLSDSQTAQMAEQYLIITGGATLFSFLNTTLTGLYTAQGDSKTPLLANGAGLVLNMLLDPALILGVGPLPRLEVIGAAVATVSAQLLVTIILALGMKNGNLLRQSRLYHLSERRYFSAIVRMGGPSALQSTCYCAISMALTRMVGAYGEGAIAVQRVGGQIESLTWNTSDGFGSAMNAFAAQNYGAGKLDRIRKSYRFSAILVAVWGALVGGAFLLFPEGISSLFFHEADVIPLCADYFTIIALSEPFLCVELMAIGAMSGLGHTRQCSTISILVTALRIPMAWALCRSGLGLNGVWWALTITSIIKGLMLHVYFHRACARLEAHR